MLGFLVTILFYLNMGRFSPPAVMVKNPMQDSLISINARLKAQIATLQAAEKKLNNVLQAHTQKLKYQQVKAGKQKQKIYLNLHSSWDSLTKTEREKYTDQLIKKFKNQKP